MPIGVCFHAVVMIGLHVSSGILQADTYREVLIWLPLQESKQEGGADYTRLHLY